MGEEMILHKETRQKFGYWPKNLGAYSKKKVIKKCDNCSSKKSVGYVQFINGQGSLCQKCGANNASWKTKDARQRRWDNVPIAQSLSGTKWIDYYCSGYMKKDPKGFSRLCVTLPGLTQENVLVEEQAALFKMLSLRRKGVSTKDFKSALKSWFLIQNPGFRRSVVWYYLETTSSGKILESGRTTIRINFDMWGEIFSSAGIELKPRSQRRSKVDSASIFLRGRWIHIG